MKKMLMVVTRVMKIKIIIFMSNIKDITRAQNNNIKICPEIDKKILTAAYLFLIFIIKNTPKKYIKYTLGVQRTMSGKTGARTH
jgi:hypothetical protein